MAASLSDFWRRYHEFFDVNDGSLPEVRFEDVADRNLPRLFAFVCANAERLSDSGFWHLEEQRDVQLRDVPNPALLVAEGTAEAFHFVASGLTVGKAQLPEIGVFVARGEFALDYQPGPQWDHPTVLTFLSLICQLRKLAPEARVTTEPHVVDEWRLAFEREVMQFCDRDAAI